MSDFVLDASLALQWFLEDESEREYSLEVFPASPKIAQLFHLCGFTKLEMDS